MYRIFVKDLEVFAYHGVHKFEKEKGQPFLFNISVWLKNTNLDDDINKTISYSDIIRVVKEINQQNEFDLIETAGKVISEEIIKLSSFVYKVKVNIQKPNAPIKAKFRSVGIEVVDKNHIDKKRCYLSLGSNIGDRESNIEKAIAKISRHKFVSIEKLSSIYRTEPMYEKEQEYFFNIIALINIGSTDPFEFLGFLKRIEYDQGRSKGRRYGPRIIDIDIIYWEGFLINSGFLTIPHPRYRERNFVLLPLSEVNPGFMIDGMKIGEYIDKKSYREGVKLIKPTGFPMGNN
ncbi:MAG: 2-amino-4-hydroxy-6-hydroxymethyldihydropteridine diphosphokinase [Candidatus Humimicrobiaceae bacterium]